MGVEESLPLPEIAQQFGWKVKIPVGTFKRKCVSVFNCQCHHREFVVHRHDLMFPS
jgi:hypothetical protein